MEGVEVDQYTPTALPIGDPVVIFAAQMLRDKGVNEFVNVARSIKEKGIKAEFVLVGDIDIHNSASVSQSEIDEWVSKKIVSHLNRQTHMKAIYSQATITCLPSYHEGPAKSAPRSSILRAAHSRLQCGWVTRDCSEWGKRVFQCHR